MVYNRLSFKNKQFCTVHGSTSNFASRDNYFLLYTKCGLARHTSTFTYIITGELGAAFRPQVARVAPPRVGLERLTRVLAQIGRQNPARAVRMELGHRNTAQPALVGEDVVATRGEFGDMRQEHDLAGLVLVPLLLGDLLSAGLLQIDLDTVAVICNNEV